jgi:hypothetical protein
MLIVMGKRQVVAEQDHPHRRVAQEVQKTPDRRQILALHLHQHEARGLGGHGAVDGLHQRGFPHPPRAPEQRVVGRQALRELARVLQERVARPVDPQKERQVHPVDARHGLQPVGVGMPDEGLRSGPVGRLGGRRAQTLQRLGDPAERVLGHGGNQNSSPSSRMPSSRRRRLRLRSPPAAPAGSRSRKARRPREEDQLGDHVRRGDERGKDEDAHDGIFAHVAQPLDDTSPALPRSVSRTGKLETQAEGEDELQRQVESTRAPSRGRPSATRCRLHRDC